MTDATINLLQIGADPDKDTNRGARMNIYYGGINAARRFCRKYEDDYRVLGWTYADGNALDLVQLSYDDVKKRFEIITRTHVRNQSKEWLDRFPEYVAKAVRAIVVATLLDIAWSEFLHRSEKIELSNREGAQ